MSTKEILTSKFEQQKKNFSIHDELDDLIKSFIIQLNEHPDIVTHYSCEGESSPLELGEPNSHSIWAYFGMNVSERYWDYFWSNVVPDLILTMDVKISTNCFNEAFFFHAVSLERKYEFWNTMFEVFKKHGIVKEKIIEKTNAV